jgi:hypothetical protein
MANLGVCTSQKLRLKQQAAAAAAPTRAVPESDPAQVATDMYMHIPVLPVQVANRVNAHHTPGNALNFDKINCKF